MQHLLHDIFGAKKKIICLKTLKTKLEFKVCILSINKIKFTIFKYRFITSSKPTSPADRNIEQFHIAIRANITEETPHSSLKPSMSSCFEIVFEPPLFNNKCFKSIENN